MNEQDKPEELQPAAAEGLTEVDAAAVAVSLQWADTLKYSDSANATAMKRLAAEVRRLHSVDRLVAGLRESDQQLKQNIGELIADKEEQQQEIAQLREQVEGQAQELMQVYEHDGTVAKCKFERVIKERDQLREQLQEWKDLAAKRNDEAREIERQAFAGIQAQIAENTQLRERLGRAETGPLKLDTESQVFFYEQDHYYLSNFSSFGVHWRGLDFDTSEHAYHYEKFPMLVGGEPLGISDLQAKVRAASSAHEAFKIAERNRDQRRPDWDAIKFDVMRQILRAKVEQHEYVRRKLLQTGDRELIENSWRDDIWGWGPNRDGQNMLGKLWMEIRAALREATP